MVCFMVFFMPWFVLEGSQEFACNGEDSRENELGLPIWFAVPGCLDGCLAAVGYFRLMSSGVSVEASIATIVSRTHLAFMSISSLGKSFSSFSK